MEATTPKEHVEFLIAAMDPAKTHDLASVIKVWQEMQRCIVCHTEGDVWNSNNSSAVHGVIADGFHPPIAERPDRLANEKNQRQKTYEVFTYHIPPYCSSTNLFSEKQKGPVSSVVVCGVASASVCCSTTLAPRRTNSTSC